jgi:hypothetical protein
MRLELSPAPRANSLFNLCVMVPVLDLAVVTAKLSMFVFCKKDLATQLANRLNLWLQLD